MTSIRASADVGRFQCCACGSCCVGWAVEIDPPAEKRLAAALATKPHPRWGAEVPADTGKDGRRWLRKDGDRCVFLTEENLCWIQREVGVEAMPEICRTFPRRVSRTPLGDLLTLGFSCHTAAGLLLDDNLEGEREADLPLPPAGPLAPFALAQGEALKPAEARAVEEAILAILARGDRGAAENLAAAAALVEDLRAPHRVGDRSGFAATLRRHLESPPPPPPARPVTEHLQVLRAIFKHRRAFVFFGGPSQENIERIFRLLDEVFALEDPSARPPATVRFGRALARHWRPHLAALDPVMGRHARRSVLSRHFTHPFGFAGGLRVVAILHALVRALASAAAVAAGRPVEPRDLPAAIWPIEREFVHNKATLAFWGEILKNPLASKPWFVPLLVL